MTGEDSVSFCSVVVNFLLFAGSVYSSSGGVALTQRMRVVLETFVHLNVLIVDNC